MTQRSFKLAPPPLAHRILWQLLYETERIVAPRSVKQYLHFDLRKDINARRRFREEQRRERETARQSLHYLTTAALISTSKAGRQQIWKLTPTGRVRALVTLASVVARHRRRFKMRRGGRGPWLVSFDIPETHRRLRDVLRRVLYQFDGEWLQKSLFLIRDFPEYELVSHLTKAANLRPYVIIAEVRSWQGKPRGKE